MKTIDISIRMFQQIYLCLTCTCAVQVFYFTCARISFTGNGSYIWFYCIPFYQEKELSSSNSHFRFRSLPSEKGGLRMNYTTQMDAARKGNPTKELRRLPKEQMEPEKLVKLVCCRTGRDRQINVTPAWIRTESAPHSAQKSTSTSEPPRFKRP